MNLFCENLDPEKYIIAGYNLKSSENLKSAALNIAIGQSLGNPSARSNFETEELIKTHACMIIGNERKLSKVKEGYIQIGFPIINTDFAEDGVSHLLCQLMGGQLDIDSIETCQLVDLRIPDCVIAQFKPPQFGITGIRNYVNSHNRPLVGGIIKPKTGFDLNMYERMLTELAEGGLDFIKEDEIIADPAFCRLKDRVKIAHKVRWNTKIDLIIAHTINADPHKILDKANMIADYGGNGLHINVWCGYGAYRSVRELDLPLFIHFQKSGDKIITDEQHRFHIGWNVICQIAALSGVDFIHAGMWGGYLSVSEATLKQNMETLHKYNVMPVLSCGMHPGLVKATEKRFGCDFMANVGGCLHSHPMGSRAGAQALRDAADCVDSEEYRVAIKKWGLVN